MTFCLLYPSLTSKTDGLAPITVAACCHQVYDIWLTYPDAVILGVKAVTSTLMVPIDQLRRLLGANDLPERFTIGNISWTTIGAVGARIYLVPIMMPTDPFLLITALGVLKKELGQYQDFADAADAAAATAAEVAAADAAAAAADAAAEAAAEAAANAAEAAEAAEIEATHAAIVARAAKDESLRVLEQTKMLAAKVQLLTDEVRELSALSLPEPPQSVPTDGLRQRSVVAARP